jgi:hypothetical protein
MNSTSLEIHPNSEGVLSFTPLYAPNAIFVAIFTILLLVHCILAYVYSKFYGYAIGMIGGLLLELLGCTAKLMLSHNPENKNGYIM